MNMLQALKFVMGGVSKKDMVPEMKHFAIEGGRVRSYNGRYALSSPIPFDIDCFPKADVLYRAIANCEETVQLSMTPAGKLRVQSGPFRALVSCVTESVVHVEPAGERVEVNGEALLKAFKCLLPFVGDDASRPWANGILMRGKSAFATCNVVLIEYWLGFGLPHTVNIPADAVKEVVRVGEPPEYVQLEENSITFHYTDGRWIRTQLFSTEWPPIEKILAEKGNQSPIDDRIFPAMEKLKNFLDKSGRVVFTVGAVQTAQDDNEEGGKVELPGSTMQGVYTYEFIMLLKGVATHIDFGAYPNACMFQGHMVRGAILGRKM